MLLVCCLRNFSLPQDHEDILLYSKSFIVLSFTLRPENSPEVFFVAVVVVFVFFWVV